MASEQAERLAAVLAEGVDGLEAFVLAGFTEQAAHCFADDPRVYLRKAGLDAPELAAVVEVEPVEVVEPEPVIEPEPVVEPDVEPEPEPVIEPDEPALVSDFEPELVTPVTPKVTIYKYTPPDPTPTRRPKRVRADNKE